MCGSDREVLFRQLLAHDRFGYQAPSPLGSDCLQTIANIDACLFGNRMELHTRESVAEEEDFVIQFLARTPD